jgi:hypothetical protein
VGAGPVGAHKLAPRPRTGDRSDLFSRSRRRASFVDDGRSRQPTSCFDATRFFFRSRNCSPAEIVAPKAAPPKSPLPSLPPLPDGGGERRRAACRRGNSNGKRRAQENARHPKVNFFCGARRLPIERTNERGRPPRLFRKIRGIGAPRGPFPASLSLSLSSASPPF